MDAQEFVDTARKATGYVRVTFPKTAVGRRCLRILMQEAKLAGMVASAADRNEIENVLMLDWSNKTSFCFMDLGKVDENALQQLARDIVSAN